MSQIKIKADEWDDIIVLFLLDKITDESFSSTNERFNDLSKKLQRGGIKQYLYRYFLETDTDSKVKYKQVKSALNGTGHAAIVITEDFVKEIVSKVTGKKNPNPIKLQKLLEELNKGE